MAEPQAHLRDTVLCPDLGDILEKAELEMHHLDRGGSGLPEKQGGFSEP